ncbi:hypothetical protein DAPPUDRAFT_240733 [Daphnia pulex]|uniref:Uncharacterized protein n=1 Tax=Daphnia pulex TaxID=6669 RepID=E9GCD4_DAPPU|nr:hypothetical protein DAPPUDRAFT_240733 [Daphnia pulex]|eukprot:EFX82875.1 hypothetical protein DAPPUDRAFT_240733 [Daphnia pulex]
MTKMWSSCGLCGVGVEAQGSACSQTLHAVWQPLIHLRTIINLVTDDNQLATSGGSQAVAGAAALLVAVWQTTDRQSPHYPANNNNGPVVLFNNDQSVNQHPNYNPFQNDIAVSFHQFKPGKPSLIQNDGIHPSSAMDHQNEFVELFPDSQLRTNGLSRYRPDIIRGSLELPAQDRRLLFFSGVTLSTFFTKTVTFSVTVPLITLTTTTSCIPLALFAVPTQTIILPTAVIPLPGANRSNRQVSVDQSALSDQLLSPDGDVIRGSLSLPERHVTRGKRYFILSDFVNHVDDNYHLLHYVNSRYKVSPIGR